MGQIYSNQSGSVNAYVLPPGIPGGKVGQEVTLAYMKGFRSPTDIAWEMGKRFLWGTLFAGIFVVVILLYKMKYHPGEPLFYKTEREKFDEQVKPFDPGF